jgi:hypothetical protein
LPDGLITLRVAAFNAPPGQTGSEITAMGSRTWRIQNVAPASFTAQLVTAPPGGALLNSPPYFSPVRFEVRGSGLRNVELVSANNESIVYGRFNLSPEGTTAILDWDFSAMRYISYDLKIIAWDVPPGQPGRKIEVMSARRYGANMPLGCSAANGCVPAP